ncbi:hypothetical protein CJ010_00700 [Azoarcus sp. DD4]|uniref:hypothetical protein n=1 Tax=Azoarcus sp. DD4 TaxID=2027405 RepID=UPI00112C2AA5|nr:hypothetical protein [Azoarcus sp. DD4]QDF95172.1 hypothetical protein CJ010_00700 [Azoarcus sp. DD4]
MDNTQFDELAGRIDAVYMAFGALVAELEDAAVIDGPRLVQGLRRSAAQRHTDNPGTAASVRTLQDIADRLEDARNQRHR